MGRSKELPPAAKLVYGRLRRYAGRNGLCYPAVPTLAAEVALGKRQVQKILRELEAKGFLRCVKRFNTDGDQTSNSYEFLWHRIFDEPEPDAKFTGGSELQFAPPVHPRSLRRVHGGSPRPVHSSSHKEGHYEEGHIQEWRPGSLRPVNFGHSSFYVDSDDETGQDNGE